jgi:hypothetical protein
MKPDREIDLHGYTSKEARTFLDKRWAQSEWHGLQRIRIIHGTGDVLHGLVRLWCEEKGLMWTTEERNPGVTILHPGRRLQTPAPPPHRPLNGLKQRLSPAQRRAMKPESASDIPSDTQDRARSSGGEDDVSTDLMAAEFDRLGEADAFLLHKRKHNLSPPKPTNSLSDKSDSPRSQPPAPSLPAPDLMAEEFERLGRENITPRKK